MAARTEPCPDCGGTQFSEWRSEGDLTCTKCGLVVEAHMIDERSEWRTFSDKDKDTTDPNRVGGPNNPLLQGLTTTIGREKGDKGLSYSLNRVHARANNPDKALVDAFKQIGALCDALSAGKAKDQACQIYKDAIDNKQLKGRSTQAMVAACVFMGCRNMQVPKTFKEITQVLGNDVSKKEIGRCFKELQKYLQEVHYANGDAKDIMAASNQMVQHPSVFATQYTNQLRLDWKFRRAAEDIAKLAKPIDAKPSDCLMPWDGRTPTSVASAIVYIVLCISEIRKGHPDDKTRRAAFETCMSNIHTVSNVAEATIRLAYKDMYGHLDMIMPPHFATAKEVEMLPVPNERVEPHAQASRPAAASAAAAAQQQQQNAVKQEA